MLDKLFKKAVADRKKAIKIYIFTSWIRAANDLEDNSTLKTQEKKIKESHLNSLEIFADDKEQLLPYTP